MYIWFFSLPAALFALVYESYPRLINRDFGVDIWTHLLYLKEYHKQRGIPKTIGNGFLVRGEYDYPPAFITILSKFPYSLVEKYEFLFSPFFDAIHIVVIYFISYYISGSIQVALMTQGLYVLTPIIVLENSSATPRSLGYTLFTAVFMSLFIFQKNGNITFLYIAVAAAAAIFLSHRFTTQGFLFFSLFFSSATKSLVYIEVFFASFILAVIFSKGFYWKVLRGHIGNLSFWMKNIHYRFAHQVKGNYSEYKTKDFVFRLYNQFLKFPPFVLSITNPWTLPPLYIFFFVETGSEIISKMVLWVVFSYFLALATIWVPSLRFLGEGQRYLELSAFPAAFLSAFFLSKSLHTQFGFPITILYILVSFAAFITTRTIQKKAIIKDRLRTVTPSMRRMFRYLKSMRKKPKLLCIPHQITTNTIYHTHCPVFVNADYTNIEKISDVYPYLRKPISEIMHLYNLDMILLNEEYATLKDLKLGKYKIVKRIDNVLLIQP